MYRHRLVVLFAWLKDAATKLLTADTILFTADSTAGTADTRVVP